MPTTVESMGSRGTSGPDKPKTTRKYWIHDAASEWDAIGALLAYAPASIDLTSAGLGTLVRATYELQPVESEDSSLWEASVEYISEAESSQSSPEAGDTVYEFETGGGSQHITNSIQTRASYVASGTAPDFKTAIGVTKEGVEGVDITVPARSWSERHYFTDAEVDSAFHETLDDLTGTINESPWRTYAAGEVLFMGASGSRRSSGLWEISYKFAAQKNRTGITIGDITGIAKDGWDYLWVRYRDQEDETAGAMVRVPVAVYVEQVYYTTDFADLGID